MVGIILTYHAEEPLPAGDVNPLASRIVEHIVGIARGLDISDDLAGVAAEHEDPCWRARGHKEPMMRFVKRQGEIAVGARQRPARHDLPFRAIHHRNAFRRRHIDECATRTTPAEMTRDALAA